MGYGVKSITLIGYKIPYREIYASVPYSNCSRCDKIFANSDNYCRQCGKKIITKTTNMPRLLIYHTDEIKLNGETERIKNIQYISVADNVLYKGFNSIAFPDHNWLFFNDGDYVFICIDIIKTDIQKYKSDMSKSQFELSQLIELKDKLEKELVTADFIKNYEFGIWTTADES